MCYSFTKESLRLPTWSYRTPDEAALKKKPWINARVEKALSGRYFRHMFREERVIIPAGGWYEWTLEDGKKQPWYITRKIDRPIFMAGLANFKPYTEQAVEVGFVIVTEDSGGMVDMASEAQWFKRAWENSEGLGLQSPSIDLVTGNAYVALPVTQQGV